MARDDEERTTSPGHEEHHHRGHASRGFVTALLPWFPIAIVPTFGWVWHAENTLTSMEVRVRDLEEQVDNYRATEKMLVEVKTRLDDLRDSLHRDAGHGGSAP